LSRYGINSTKCEYVREASDAYAIGALDPAEREAIERHAEMCSACREFLEHATLVGASLALTAPLRPAPRELHARVMNQLDHEGGAASATAPIKRLLTGEHLNLNSGSSWLPRPGPGHWPRSWRWLQPLAASAAVIAVIAGAAWIARLQSQIKTLQTQSRSLQRVANDFETQRSALMLLASDGTIRYDMQATDPGKGVSGAVIWNPDQHKCSVFVSGLPPAPPDQTYHVWLVGYQRSWDGGELSTSGNGTAQKTMDLNPMSSQSGYQVVVSLQQQRASSGAWQPLLKAWVGIQ
jgi:anti-sigma factor RsiW